MRKVVLDTNFIIACVKQKIDFFSEAEFMGFRVLIPENVFKEINKIIKSKQKLHNRESAKLALKVIKANKYQKIKLNGKKTDDAIAEFANSSRDIVVATLDRELKSKIKGQKMVIRHRKKLEVVE